MNSIEPAEEPMTKKEMYKALDEPRKKMYHRYYKWKYGLNNEKNLEPAVEGQIVMRNDHEYRSCCIRKAIDHQRPSRIQSAKSGGYNRYLANKDGTAGTR